MAFASLTAVAFRRFMLKEAKPVAALYSTAAKGTPAQGAAIGKELGEMFSAKRMRRNWELIPLFVIIGGAIVGLFGYIVYASQTRDDVRFFSTTNIETTDLLNPKKRKLVVYDQEYRPMSQIAEAYKGMDETKSE